jgi:cardiolipin synthase C
MPLTGSAPRSPYDAEMARNLLLLCLLGLPWSPGARGAPAPDVALAPIGAARSAHAGESGSYVLERGEQALLARAWLADRARRSIEVQYFIWSTDNIGILASEALLRAADRGVAVRVIVDDLLMDAPDETLLALARHPRIDIRIYNPVHSVGVPWYRRLLNLVTDFRGANQRMHDKTMIVDGEFAIAGGRNMADEYFDYDHHYNFRDRDALVTGAVVEQVLASFERFWASDLAVPVERLYGGYTLMGAHVDVDDARIRAIHAGLHAHAADRANFRPEVRAALDAIAAEVPAILGTCAGAASTSSVTARARMTAARDSAAEARAPRHWPRCCGPRNGKC